MNLARSPFVLFSMKFYIALAWSMVNVPVSCSVSISNQFVDFLTLHEYFMIRVRVFFLIQIQRFIHYLHDAANLTYNYNWYVKYKDFSERKFDVRCVKIRHSQNSFLILTRRYLMCLYRFRCIIGIRLITVNAKRNKKFHFKKWSQIDFDAEKNYVTNWYMGKQVVQ